MAALVVPTHRQPPALYRTARALRWAGIFLLVLALLYAGSVGYSAYEVAHATVESRALTGVSVTNSVIEVSGSFSLSNPGFYPIEGMALSVRLANDVGVFLGNATSGPQTVSGGSTGVFPITVLVPISASSAAESLLFVDQYIAVQAWANVTYAYLFPISILLSETRSWGAPFEGFAATVGTPALVNGVLTVPVTVTWSDHASFAEVGTLNFVLESSTNAVCGSGSLAVAVPPGTLFDQTQDVSLNAGCSPVGGELLASYTGNGATTPLPPETIP